jgi:hypothetical protein
MEMFRTYKTDFRCSRFVLRLLGQEGQCFCAVEIFKMFESRPCFVKMSMKYCILSWLCKDVDGVHQSMQSSVFVSS